MSDKIKIGSFYTLNEEMPDIEYVVKDYYTTTFKDARIIFTDTGAWVYRIQENINENFENEDGCCLVEREAFDNDDILRVWSEMFNYELPEFEDWNEEYEFLHELNDIQLLCAVVKLDKDNGYENYDYYKFNSLDECIDSLESIYYEEFENYVM